MSAKNIKNKKIKMIVTDLDRTLLHKSLPGDEDKKISDYSVSVLKKCIANGIKVVFATARPKRVTVQYLEQVPADALIIHNGAVIYENGKEIFHCGISPDITKNILRSISLDFPGATLSVEIDDIFYANFEVPDNWSSKEETLIDFSDFGKLSDCLPDKPAEKIIIGMGSVNMSSGNEIEYFTKYLSDDLYLQMDSGRFIMIMNRKAKKSSAVKFLAQRYCYDMGEIAAFGDDFNDVEMIKQCGVGVAVSNAIDEAKAAADYICDSNDSDGVARWIEENIL